MKLYGVELDHMGGPEDGSALVNYYGNRLAVIDTGGDYRVTEWCPRARDWCGKELHVAPTFQEALAHCIRVLKRSN